MGEVSRYATRSAEQINEEYYFTLIRIPLGHEQDPASFPSTPHKVRVDELAKEILSRLQLTDIPNEVARNNAVANAISNAIIDKVLTSDPRLTNQRIPVNGSVTNAKVSPDAAIDQSKIAGLTGALAAKEDVGVAQALIDALAPIESVNGKTGSAITLTNADLGSAPSVHTHSTGQITDFSESVQDVIGSILADSSSIDFSYDDSSNSISALVKFGTTSGTACVGNDPRLSDARVPLAHNHVASNISDLAETIDDRVAALLVPGSNISLSYNDLNNTLTINATGVGGGGITTEDVQDIIGNALSDSASIDFVYDDNGNSITAVAKFGTSSGSVCQGNDSRLSDTRTPTDSSVTDAKVSASANIAQSKVNNLVSDLASKASSTDPRLTDTRVPTDGSVTDIKVASGANIAQSKISGLVADLAAKVNTADARLTDTRVPTDSSVTDLKVASGANIAQSKINNLVTDLAAKVDTTDSRLTDQRVPTDSSVTNAKVSASAAIAWTKISKTGAVASDVGAAASSHTHSTGQLTDFAEAVDDRVASLLNQGAGIAISYNDASNQLTVSSSITQYTDEMSQDAVGGILVDSPTIDLAYDDSSNTISASVVPGSITNNFINSSAAIDWAKINKAGAVASDIGAASAVHNHTVANISDFNESVDDRVSGLLANSGSITWAYDDVANSIQATVNTGETTGLICAADDARLSNQRVPVDGSVDDSKVASGAAIAQSKINNLVSDLAGKQAASNDLTAYSNLTTTGLVERTGAGSVVTNAISGFIKTILNAADQATARALLGAQQLLSTVTSPVSFNDQTISRYGIPVRAEAGTTYEVSAADNGWIIEFTAATLITVTVPAGLPPGFNVSFRQAGAGRVFLDDPNSGANFINSQGFYRTATQSSMISLMPTTTPNLYNVVGHVGAA